MHVPTHVEKKPDRPPAPEMYTYVIREQRRVLHSYIALRLNHKVAHCTQRIIHGQCHYHITSYASPLMVHIAFDCSSNHFRMSATLFFCINVTSAVTYVPIYDNRSRRRYDNLQLITRAVMDDDVACSFLHS